MHAEYIGARYGVDCRIDRCAAHDDRQCGHASPPCGPELAVEAVLAPRSADHADADEHRLLDDDDDDGGHDEGSVTQVGVEEVVRLVDDRLRYGLCLRDVGPLGDQALELDHGARLSDCRNELLEDLAVHQEVAGVAIDCHVGLQPSEEVPLVVGGNVDHAVDLAVVEEFPGLLHVRRLVGDVGVRSGVEGLDQRTACLRAALVHDADRHVAQHLRAVGQRIDRGVDQQGEDQHQHDAAVGEDRAELVPHDAPELGPVGCDLSAQSVHATTSPRIFPRWPRV